MSIGPSDENIDFKAASQPVLRMSRSSRALTILLVTALILLFAIVAIQQRELSDLTRKIDELRADVNTLKSSTGH